MKILMVSLSLIISILIICGCVKGAEVKTSGKVVELAGFEVKPGKYCESTTMMNALNYQGLNLSESMHQVKEKMLFKLKELYQMIS